MTQSDYMQDRAVSKWNAEHPLYWPTPPRQMPKWFQFKKRIELRDMEEVFGHIDQPALNRFWSEMGKGQSVYEDAGSYMLRCYEALAGFPIEEPYTYAQAVDGFVNEQRND